jgi:hypothetical protein
VCGHFCIFIEVSVSQAVYTECSYFPPFSHSRRHGWKWLAMLFLQLGNSRWLASARCMTHGMNDTVVKIMMWRFLLKDGHLVDLHSKRWTPCGSLQWPSSSCNFHLTDTELLVKSSKVHCWKFAYQLAIFVAWWYMLSMVGLRCELLYPDYRIWLA